jgi:hypothetical protein
MVRWSLPGYVLLSGAAAALILMVVLIAVAVISENAQVQELNGRDARQRRARYRVREQQGRLHRAKLQNQGR